MSPSHFADFEDENEFEFEGSSESCFYDHYLTVRGLLRTHFGTEHGDEIYDLLFRTAKITADSVTSSPAAPGILFNEDGGEFVGFDQNAVTEDEEGF